MHKKVRQQIVSFYKISFSKAKNQSISSSNEIENQAKVN